VLQRITHFFCNGRIGLLSLALVTFLIVSTLTRLVLMLANLSDLQGSLLYALPSILIGIVFDFVVALGVTFPLALFLLVFPDRWIRRAWGQWLLGLGFMVYTFGLLYLAVTEYFFFAEFAARFNYVAVDYLIYPHEVFVNIWETYPVLQVLIVDAVVSILALFALMPLIRRATAAPSPWKQRGKTALLCAVLIAVGLGSMNIDSARISNNRVMNEITANGIYSFFHAFATNELDYDLYYATLPKQAAFDRLRTLVGTDGSTYLEPADSLVLDRSVDSKNPTRPFNIVLVVEESFGSKFIGTLTPDGPNCAPNIDSLADRGLLFTNIYATGNRTVRGLEASLASFPPIPGRSIVKRPGCENVFTLPSVLKGKGYQTVFMYAGLDYFDNIGHFMSNNNFDRVLDEPDMQNETFKTIWGVCDEDLFNNALRICDSLHEQGKPFFTTLLTVSNHSPYTYPKGKIPYDPDRQLRRNAVRYADFAYGQFVRDAASHAFFDSTLFVFVADHGARVYGAQEIPMDSYRIPILMYSPALLPPGERDSTLASQMDLGPTVLDLLGIDYNSAFFGRSILNRPPEQQWALMSHNRDVGILKGDTVAVLGIEGGTELYRRDPSNGELAPVSSDDTLPLVKDAIAYFESAYDMFKGHRTRPLPQTPIAEDVARQKAALAARAADSRSETTGTQAAQSNGAAAARSSSKAQGKR